MTELEQLLAMLKRAKIAHAEVTKVTKAHGCTEVEIVTGCLSITHSHNSYTTMKFNAAGELLEVYAWE